MGYLVLQSKDDKTFDIIDGQQRLTTLSIAILAGLRNLQRLIQSGVDTIRTQQRLDGLRQAYVGFLDPVTLVSKSKLTLNRNNDHYYQTYIITLSESLPQRGFKASEHSLRKAFDWFDGRIRDYTKNRSDQGLEIAKFVDEMSDRLFFTVITVTDELNAYKVFETLNARGVKLSATDLLKNYLFSVLHRDGQDESELKTLDDRWEKIVGRLGAESFPDFLRVHWISRKSFVRQADLFKTIRSQIIDKGHVFSLLQGMDDDIDVYLGLSNPDGSTWSKAARDSSNLLKMFSVRQPYPLLLSVKRKMSFADFEVLLRAVVVISFRYNIIGNLQSGEQERVYHSCAEKVTKSDFINLKDVLDGLKPIYPSDDSFKAAFSQKSISTTQSRNRKIAKYILSEIETITTGIEIDYGADNLTIEHICPTNPIDNWDTFTDQDIEEMTSRIGNMTLLNANQNIDLGNKAYSEKKPVYATSQYQMSRDVAEQNNEWSPNRINARQNALSHKAASIWKVSQLS